MSFISWLKDKVVDLVDDPDSTWTEELYSAFERVAGGSLKLAIDEALDLYVSSGTHDSFQEQKSKPTPTESSNQLIDAEVKSDPPSGQQPMVTPEQIKEMIESGQITQQAGRLMMQQNYGMTIPPSAGTMQITDQQVYAAGGAQPFKIDTNWLSEVGGQPVFSGTYGFGGVPQGTLGVRPVPTFQMMAEQTDEEGVTSVVPIVDEFNIPRIVTEVDPVMEEQGFIFKRLSQYENKAFTIADALRIYDAQDPEAQRLIAEGLALGDGRVSYMIRGDVGNMILRDPSLVYDRDSVFFALENIANEAAARADVLREHPTETGYETLDMIPALRDAELATEMQPRRLGEPVATRPRGSLSVGKLTDYLFNLAVEAGAVKQVTKAYSDKLAASVYTALTGRKPDDAFYVLADQWTREVDTQKMGTGRPSSATVEEYAAYYGQEIEEEYSDKIDAQTGRHAKSALLEALGVG